MIKVPSEQYPSPKALELLRHEYKILQLLAIAEVVRPIELVPNGAGLALVLEDVGGGSWDQIIQSGTPSIVDALRLASKFAGAVQAVHDRRIIHKDLKPHHVFQTESGGLKLIDFGISTNLAVETPELADPDTLEGTLAYIAPEQTGRMNRVVDRRSDLYSMGVMLFELMTQQLPFTCADALEYVHAHVARPPPRADQVRSEIPATVGAIIEKLMAKAAEDRYQSAAGLRVDLDRCLSEFEKTGQVSAFELGTEDASDVLRLPQKLYGRTAELQVLQESFEAAQTGSPQVMMIAGHSGVGKSVLVHELHRSLVLAGAFVSGKFEPINRGLPYRALAQACRQLVRSLLAQSTSALEASRTALQEALGANGQLIVDLVPELERVIGPQSPVAPLGPNESQNRFEHVFLSFLSYFATERASLVVFLDNLQWADAASLRLLKLVITQPGHRRLLVLGAYRDNEVSATHPLMLELEVLSKAGGAVSTLPLQPLRYEAVCELLQDTLSRDAATLAPLARLLFDKTQGNPFFATQFLETLHRGGQLRLDTTTRQWDWDMEAIEQLRVTDNVVDLMLDRLHKLPDEIAEVLSLAACMGQKFDAQTLAVLVGRPHAELQQQLAGALDEGLVVPMDDKSCCSGVEESDAISVMAEYGFLHDRVQQAAYALIDERERQGVHLQIGRLLRTSHGEDAEDEQGFEVADHLNRGAARIEDESERVWLAGLNLRCGRRARNAAAANVATTYLSQALALLGTDAWSHHYAMTCPAHLLLADCEFLEGHTDVALALVAQVESHATAVLDRVAAGNLKTVLLTHMGRLQEACKSSVETLALLSVDIPGLDDPAALGAAIGAEFGASQAALADREIESLLQLPEMTDPTQLALLDTLAKTIPAAFQTTKELMILVVLKGVQLPLQHGTAPLSPFFYAQYGLAHSVITGDYATAHRFGKLGIEIGTRRGELAALGQTHFIFAAFISHWREHISVSLEHFELGIRRSFELGDYMHAAYCIGMRPHYRLYAGHALAEIGAELPAALETVDRMEDVINHGFLVISRQVIASLSGETPRFGCLTGEDFDESSFEAQSPPPVLAFYGAAKAMLRYYAGEYKEALAATTDFPLLPALFYHAEYSFYRGLCHAALAWQSDGTIRETHLSELNTVVEQFEQWAELSPRNHRYRHCLLAAERATLLVEETQAMNLYDAAIAEAQRQGFIHHQGLAQELCGKFYLRLGRERIAQAYLTDAQHTYQRWGASSKVRQLAEEHANLGLRLGGSAGGLAPAMCTATVLTEGTIGGSSTHHASTLATSGAGSLDLDLESAMRATQALTSELQLGKLIDRLLRIVIENSGGQRGVLVFPQAGELRLQAVITVEPDKVRVGLNECVEESAEVPAQIVQYVARSQETIVLGNAQTDSRFAQDDYVQARRPRSVLCLALMRQGEVRAILYLENNAAEDAFSPARVSRLEFLASHAASALENAQLYEEVETAKQSLEQANASLERRVNERTSELEQRNHDMRRVLDNVKQGLLTLNAQGELASERSAALDEWFGGYSAGTRCADYFRPFSASFADWFDLAWESVAEGFMPLEVCLDQFPRRLKWDANVFELSYEPIMLANELVGVLIVVDDVTEREHHARAEALQNEQLAVLRAFARDRDGLQQFFSEASELVAKLQETKLDPVVVKRLLHTLKGNSAMVGLKLMPKIVHAAEEVLDQDDPQGQWRDP